MTLRRRVTAITILGALILVALGSYLATKAPPADRDPHPFNHDRNATWLEHRWLERTQPEAAMESLLATLSARGVRYVFPHVIPFDKKGRLPSHSREQMRAFLAASRRVAPDMKVLPWIGGVRSGYRRMRAGTVDLTDITQRQQIVAECRGLIDEGFHGVHVDVEPIDDGNVEFVALLNALRTAIGPDRILSVSTIRPGPLGLPGAPNFLWTADYYRRIATVADQIVVMVYDTGLPTIALYRRYVSYAARFMTTTLGPHTRARVLFGVPSYDESGLMHRARVETLENALLGVVSGLRGAGEGGTFEGVAIYAEWTTDAQEWATYEQVWRGRSEKDPLGSGASDLQIPR
jgi:Glycosyl hydrolases family 18